MRFTARPRMGRLRAVGRCLRGGPRRDRPLMGPRGRPRPPPEGVRRLRVWFARLLACRSANAWGSGDHARARVVLNSSSSANAACQKCAARQSRVKTHRELLREFRSICFERFAHLLQNGHPSHLYMYSRILNALPAPRPGARGAQPRVPAICDSVHGQPGHCVRVGMPDCGASPRRVRLQHCHWH